MSNLFGRKNVFVLRKAFENHLRECFYTRILRLIRSVQNDFIVKNLCENYVNEMITNYSSQQSVATS